MNNPYPLNRRVKLNTTLSKVTNVHVTCLVGLFILIRMSVFWHTQDVGLEVDGGWYLGVSRIIAARNIYASYVNYSNNPQPGATPNILKRLTVQDMDGYSYFPAGVTAGPAYILPHAFTLKLFGNNYFAYKVFPFVTSLLLLLLLTYLTCSMSGKLGGILIGMWLWSRPDLYTNQMLDAFGESLCLLYLVLSLIFAIKGKKTNKDSLYMLSGVFFGLAFLTKLLVLLMGVAFIYICIHDVHKNGWSRARRWILWGFSFLLPVMAFEGYRYVYIMTHFGYSGYVATNGDFYIHLVGNGSGVGKIKDNLQIIFQKLSLWRHLNMVPALSWLAFFTSIFYGRFIKDLSIRMIFQSMWFAALGCFVWYLLVSPSGWFRHAWFSIMLFLPLVVVMITQAFWQLQHQRTTFGFGVIGIILVTMSIMGNLANSSFLLQKNSLNEMWSQWPKGTSPNHLQGPVFAPIFSWKEQKETAKFLKSHIPLDKHIYFSTKFTVAEMATLSDRVFYPIFRYLSERGTGYLILGPYQKGFASYLTKEQHDAIVANYCDKVVFSNPSYTICHLYEISGE